MNQKLFEERLLHLWVTTRVPLTRANLLFYAKAPRAKMDGWLDELVRDGILEVDADDAGEMIWQVRGAARAANGATRLDQIRGVVEPPAQSGGDLGARLDQLRAQATRTALSAGASLALASRRPESLLRAPGEGEKSLLTSGLLGLFFGPLGLLYAAPFKVAVPLSIAMLAACYLLGWHVLGFSLIFGALGVAYAWRYNQRGERAPLLGEEPGEGPRPALPRR